MKKGLIALGIVVSFVGGAAADKVITELTAVAGDIQRICEIADSSAPNGWRIEAVTKIRRSDGTSRIVMVTANASAGQATTLNSFAGQIATVTNTQEGL